jgi:hypothetical protein
MARTKQKRKVAAVRASHGASRKSVPTALPPSKQLAGKDLERAVEQFQSEPDETKAHQQWKEIETSIFDVQFED